MTPQTFIAIWGAPDGVPGPAYALNEEQGEQSHFLDLCELLGVPKPGSAEGYPSLRAKRGNPWPWMLLALPSPGRGQGRCQSLIRFAF